MRDFNYYSPTEFVFGKDSEKNCGALCKKYGATKVFVVYGGGSAVKSGLLDRVCASVKESGLDVMSMGGVVPNPLLSSTMEMVDAAIAFGADMIVGIGGGSAIDQAKAVAHGVANPGINVWDFWTLSKKLEKSIPIGAVPTLPATGTEGSSSSVITNDLIEDHSKRGFNTDFNRCAFAIMNPALCMTLPDYQKGAGAADIFMHNAERFFTTVQGNHLSDELAFGVFKNIMKYGPLVISEPDNYEAMSEVMHTGTFAHNDVTGLGSKGDTARAGDWACHQLGMTISAIYDSTHGATLTAVFGSWARYVMDADYRRFAEFAKNIFGLSGDDKSLAISAVEGIEKFFSSLGMPLSITELLGREISDEELDVLANNCTYDRKRTIGTFKVLGYDDIRQIFKNAR